MRLPDEGYKLVRWDNNRFSLHYHRHKHHYRVTAPAGETGTVTIITKKQVDDLDEQELRDKLTHTMHAPDIVRRILQDWRSR